MLHQKTSIFEVFFLLLQKSTLFKMKKICFILVLCHSFIALAQTPTFTWSEGKSSIENELNYSIQNYFDGKRIFNVRSIYNDKIFNKDVFVDIFSSNDDFEKDENNFSNFTIKENINDVLKIIDLEIKKSKLEIQIEESYPLKISANKCNFCRLSLVYGKTVPKNSKLD